MAEKTPTKTFLDSLVVGPKVTYQNLDNGHISSMGLIVRGEDGHLPRTWRRAKTTITSDQINHEREGYSTDLPGGGTFTVYSMTNSEKEILYEVGERLSAYLPQQKEALFKGTSEAIKEQEKAARKERMHSFIGMFSDIEQDSVELQKELREDWS